eukprot:TRINITY_DN3999_c0_g1_i4.p1 TRINITY_DN3999_c0_g1~~TRINITY_DN3999_c0_g1_i4.p1  ORF type:complete len:251 (-),score=72.47 TRINITY_DN3999_c0_g1_i4:112-864(-)
MSLTAVAAKNITKAQRQQEKEVTSPDAQVPNWFAKMPEGYDFSNKGVNWEEYGQESILRTDAVWEKSILRDGFRLFMKCFYFDKGSKKYVVFEPEEIYSIIFEPWAFEEFVPFTGFTPTGRTNSFQIGLGPKQRLGSVSAQTNFIRQDYYDLCALRFEKWWKCDSVYNDLREKKYDYREDQENFQSYPCYREFYETTYACMDDMFDFLMELQHAKQADDFFLEDRSNHELTLFPTKYDRPDAAKNDTLTY